MIVGFSHYAEVFNRIWSSTRPSRQTIRLISARSVSRVRQKQTVKKHQKSRLTNFSVG